MRRRIEDPDAPGQHHPLATSRYRNDVFDFLRHRPLSRLLTPPEAHAQT